MPEPHPPQDESSNPVTPCSLKALVLAGGKGTRLRPLTYAMAKQLVPVANKPILHYALDSLYQAEIFDFGIIISPETGESVKQSVQQWQTEKEKPVSLTFIGQDSPAGLAHAVKIAQPYLQASSFLMYLGDNLINADLKAHCKTFIESHANARILLKPVSNPGSFGVAQCNEEGQVLQLDEKPAQPKSNLALVGVYLFDHSIFEAVNAIQPSARGELEITDAIQHLINTKKRVDASIHEGWWLDTGKKDDLLAANHIILGELTAATVLGRVDAESVISGAVYTDSDSSIENSRIIGPVSIGKGVTLQNCEIGPYTSIGNFCQLSGVKLSNSVLLENSCCAGVKTPIVNSIIGKNTRILGASENRNHQTVVVADDSYLELA
ncbi:MAG: glucose-1-phosphate thymidylyltransferase [Cyanobacteria bacterium P01_H01_bin.74]